MMAEHRSLLLVDFLGFGASDKPREHVYSLIEQTDLVTALWADEGIQSTAVVAHGYAVSVGQELLARRAEGTLPVQLTQMVLLNGGIYPELARRAHAQSRLLDPAIGHTLSRRLDQEAFVAELAPTFARGYDGRKASIEMWDAYSRDDGQLNSHLLIRYLSDRQAHRDRWVHAHETTDVPLTFVWGLQDPGCGVEMAAQITRNLPSAPFHELPDVGHWPSVEAPDRVTESVLAARI